LEPTMTTRKFFASSGRPRRRGSLFGVVRHGGAARGPSRGVSEEIKLLNRINSENLESPRIA